MRISAKSLLILSAQLPVEASIHTLQLGQRGSHNSIPIAVANQLTKQQPLIDLLTLLRLTHPLHSALPRRPHLQLHLHLPHHAQQLAPPHAITRLHMHLHKLPRKRQRNVCLVGRVSAAMPRRSDAGLRRGCQVQGVGPAAAEGLEGRVGGQAQGEVVVEDAVEAQEVFFAGGGGRGRGFLLRADVGEVQFEGVAFAEEERGVAEAGCAAGGGVARCGGDVGFSQAEGAVALEFGPGGDHVLEVGFKPTCAALSGLEGRVGKDAHQDIDVCFDALNSNVTKRSKPFDSRGFK